TPRPPSGRTPISGKWRISAAFGGWHGSCSLSGTGAHPSSGRQEDGQVRSVRIRLRVRRDGGADPHRLGAACVSAPRCAVADRRCPVPDSLPPPSLASTAEINERRTHAEK